jgi:hypothetical protein
MTTILETFDLRAVTPASMAAKYKAVKDLPVIPSKQVIGIEVEVENYAAKQGVSTMVWNLKDDGSLRNNGAEFVSQPIEADMAPFALHHLMNNLLSQECCFSPRTSIHIHADMQKWQVDQVKNLVMWYTAFEPLFYKFTGRGRAKNIYCVPVNESNILANFERARLPERVAQWSKYTGLNIHPLSSLGTIEFRHMHGTFDVTKVCTWIRLICRLCDWVNSKTVSEHRERLSTLGDTTDYPSLLREIFGDDVQYMKYMDYVDIRDSTNMVKFAFGQPNVLDALAREVSLDAPFFKFKKQANQQGVA